MLLFANICQCIVLHRFYGYIKVYGFMRATFFEIHSTGWRTCYKRKDVWICEILHIFIFLSELFSLVIYQVKFNKRYQNRNYESDLTKSAYFWKKNIEALFIFSLVDQSLYHILFYTKVWFNLVCRVHPYSPLPHLYSTSILVYRLFNYVSNY